MVFNDWHLTDFIFMSQRAHRTIKTEGKGHPDGIKMDMEDESSEDTEDKIRATPILQTNNMQKKIKKKGHEYRT